MNCREAHSEISAERDGALDEIRGAALNGHLAHCEACRRTRDNLATALTSWRTQVASTPTPDAEREWHAVRRRIRGGSATGELVPANRRWNLFAWIALPLGAAAALTFALVRPTQPPLAPASLQSAHADSVEAPGNNASTMVFVDDKSGWLIVVASDAQPKQG